MRQIGTVENETLAERFVDYLTTEDISAMCEADHEGWLIWVRDENQIETAREELNRFVADPDAEKYREVQQQAAELRSADRQTWREAKKHFVQMSGSWNASLSKKAPLVMAMIIACVGLFVLGGGSSIERMLLFADPMNRAVSEGDGLFNIRSGQVWRLLTPIFLHGGLLHLIFNMFWLYYLGTQVESKLGKWKFAGLVLATGVASNVLQFAISGPAFLGMSGVVFGIFGYIWMRTTHDPASGYQLSRTTVIFVMVFFAIGFVGFRIGGSDIANWAHAGGLGSGVILGLLPEWLSQKRRSA